MKRSIHLFSVIAFTLLTGRLIAAENANPSTHQSSSQKTTSSKQHYTAPHNSGRQLTLSQLPPAVQKTMRAEAGNLNLENIHKVTRNGQTAYRASFDKAGMKARLTVGEDGSVLQYQETDRLALVTEVPKITSSGMKVADLPQAVQTKVKDLAGKNTVGDVSKDTESGKPIYHVAFNDAGIHTDLVLDQSGKVLLRSDETALFTEPLKNSQTLSLQSAPAAVRNAIKEHGGTSGTVTDIDKGTWQGQTAYKVMIEKNGTARPLLLSENGQILQAHPDGSYSATGSPATSEKSSTSSSSSTHNSQQNAKKK